LRRRYLILTTDPLACARVVISLHGSGFTADTYAVTSDAWHLAAPGAVVVLPQAAIPFRLGPVWPLGFAWNILGNLLPGQSLPHDHPDDVAFFHAVLAICAQLHPGLPMHVMGYSGGARLASHVSATAPGLASVGLVVGVRSPKDMSTAPPMLAIHGQLDAINPCAGGNEARWSAGVQTVAKGWARAVGCLTASRGPTGLAPCA
jgi:polyhydroxybutyrate depolymerase